MIIQMGTKKPTFGTRIDKHYENNHYIPVDKKFSNLVLQMNENEPGEKFAAEYLEAATDFITKIKAEREALISL